MADHPHLCYEHDSYPGLVSTRYECSPGRGNFLSRQSRALCTAGAADGESEWEGVSTVRELHERADARIWSILHGYVIRPAFCRRSAWFLPLLCSLGIPDAFPITLTRRNRRTRAVPEARRSDLALQRAVCMDCVGRIFALHSQLGRARCCCFRSVLPSLS